MCERVPERTLHRMPSWRPPTPAPSAPADRRTIREEVLAVLALSLLASAVYAILSLVEAPLRGVTVAAANQDPRIARQVIGVAFGLAPVFLVWHLTRRTGEGTGGIGLALDRPRRDAVEGTVLFAIVGVVGIGIYVAAVTLGVNRFVVPLPPEGHWWTIPALLLNAAEAALVEEVIVLAYLVTRVEQLGASARGAVIASALLRGTYHLYQGWGGFAGNLVMGLFFGALFVRRRRAWPFVVAHFLLDVGAGVAYLLLRDRFPSLFS
jgi:membrane protease YdiL (CAAX protease family)